MDPLKALPQEVVIQVVSHLGITSLTRLEAISKSYLEFLNHYSDTFWQAPTLKIIPSETGSTDQPKAVKIPTLREVLKSKSKLEVLQEGGSSYWDGVENWKQLCEKQVLLSRNWGSSEPSIEVNHHVCEPLPLYQTWRFRNDFERRLVVTTSECALGLKVRDMDHPFTELWGLDARDYIHLEYSEGHFVRNVGENDLEVWRALDLDPNEEGKENKRGHFQKIATLSPNQRTRGFHLRFPDLCVVSSFGQAWIYDLSEQPPLMKHTLLIPEGRPIGHLDQDDDVVMIALGTSGYNVYDKASGNLLGSINPAALQPSNIFNIPFSETDATLQKIHLSLSLEPETSSKPLPTSQPLSEDEWGAGMISGDYMVAIANSGRAFICSDWKGLLEILSVGEQVLSEKVESCVSIIQGGSIHPADFTFGGWLSIAFGRFVFEINHRIYIVPLPAKNSLPSVANDQKPIHALRVAVEPQGRRPVSFMKLFETGILYTSETSTPYTSVIFTP